MIERWPGLPPLIPFESLSSWLRRIGIVYGLSTSELLRWGLGFQGMQICWLDRNPSEELIKAISARTGVGLETVQKATLPGLMRVVFDRIEFEKIRPGSKSIHLSRISLSDGIPWFRKPQGSEVFACRLCCEDYPNAGFLLPWQLAILLSCPVHGLMLEPAQVTTNSITWLKDSPELAPDVVHKMDSRTWAAVTEGSVKLPGGVIDAAVWFRHLNVVHGDLRKPMDPFGKRVEWQQLVCEYCPRILFQRRTQKDPARRWAIVLATALDLMEKRQMKLVGPGEFSLSTQMKYHESSETQKQRVKKEIVRWVQRWR